MAIFNSIYSRSLFYILFCLWTSCKNDKENKNQPGKSAPENVTKATTQDSIPRNTFYWTGTIDGKIPVAIQYDMEDSVIAGSIIYIHTKDKKPLKLIGTVDSEQSLRLLEFDTTGNITGIISGIPSGNTLKGYWFSPKTRKEFACSLIKKDTMLTFADFQADLTNIFGDYHYEFSEAGYQGDFQITRLPGNQVSFGISSVTGEPARNVAQIETDTIQLMKNEFIYSLPGTDDCEFRVKFYNGFVYVKYTKGFCSGQFGNNAGVDGIFLKIR